jgi:hypothetical protein
MAPPVQVQIRQAFDALQRVKADPRKSNSPQTATAYGELGTFGGQFDF